MIPPLLRKQINSDPFYQQSALSQRKSVELHHALLWKGKQLQEKFAIIPLHPDEHQNADRPDMKKKLAEIMLSRATKEDKKKYPIIFRELKRK